MPRVVVPMRCDSKNPLRYGLVGASFVKTYLRIANASWGVIRSLEGSCLSGVVVAFYLPIQTGDVRLLYFVKRTIHREIINVTEHKMTANSNN